MRVSVGDDSAEVYVFLQGSLGVLNDKGIVIGEVEPLNLVGEIGFIQDCPRTASVFCGDKRSFLWKLSRKDYHTITSKPEFYVSKIPLFLKISKEKRVVLAKYATVKKYPAQTFLARGGGSAGSLSTVRRQSRQALKSHQHMFDFSMVQLSLYWTLQSPIHYCNPYNSLSLLPLQLSIIIDGCIRAGRTLLKKGDHFGSEQVQHY